MIIEQQTSVAAPMTIIWDLITDINDWSSWHPEISLSKMDAKPAEGSPFYWKWHGVSIRGAIDVIRVNENFSWSGRGLGFHIKQNWELHATHGPTVKVFTRLHLDGIRFMLREHTYRKYSRMTTAWLAALQKQAARSCDFYQSRM